MGVVLSVGFGNPVLEAGKLDHSICSCSLVGGGEAHFRKSTIAEETDQCSHGCL